jgi:hypothetical protein
MITAALVATFSMLSTDVVVHVYNEASIGHEALRDAILVASGTLRKAGLGMKWVDCHRAEASACAADPLRVSFDIRIERRGKIAETASGRHMSMGRSLVIPGTVSSNAKIFFERVRQFAEAVDVPATAVLGFAIAHEIGHLVQGSSTHSHAGVMKAEWDHADRHRISGGHLGFLNDEIRLMRANLAKARASQR